MKSRDFLRAIADDKVQGVAQSSGLINRFRELRTKLNDLAELSGIDLIDQLWPADDPDSSDIRSFAITSIEDCETTRDLLDELTQIVTQPELPGVNDDIIRIMSLHKSKGLTAKCVVVVGCMEGALPSVHSNLGEWERTQAIQEQRRLFYVAPTRTTDTLVVSSAATGSYQDVVSMGVAPSSWRRGVTNIHSSSFLSQLGASAPRVVSGHAWRKTLGF